MNAVLERFQAARVHGLHSLIYRQHWYLLVGLLSKLFSTCYLLVQWFKALRLWLVIIRVWNTGVMVGILLCKLIW